MKDSIRKILGVPVKTPIEYWDKYWRYFTEKIGEKDNYEFSLDSPRFLIDNIISEIEYNDLNNKDYSQLFRAQLSEWDKKDAVFNDLFHDKVTSLQQKWDEFFQQGKNQKKENRKTYCEHILSLCKQINTEINKGTYFYGLLEQLVNTINDAQTLDYDTKKEINKYTELIILEFIAKGFVMDDIKSIQHDIPEIPRVEGGRVHKAPDTYKGLNRVDFSSEELYYKAIETYIENMQIEERISILRDCYNMEPKDCFALFRLTGIKGDIDCMIDGIHIYTPHFHLKQYITVNPTESKIEQTTPDRKYVNAAIPVKYKYKMLRSSIVYAKQRLEHVLDLLSLSYNTSTPIEYSERNISIVEDCKIINPIYEYENTSKHQEDIKYSRSLDITNNEDYLASIGERFTAINKNQNCDTLKLATAAHWYRKGTYSQKPEDKLLFHWIAIDSLLKTNDTVVCNITGDSNVKISKIVQKIASSIIVKRFFYNYCFDTYRDIIYKTQSDNYLEIPDEAIEKASLNMKAGNKVHLCMFFDHLKEIEEGVNDEFLKAKLHELDLFYKDNDGIKNKGQEISNDIIMIYKLRNLIAHNGVYPQDLVDLYANKAQYVSGTIIRFLIEEYRKKSGLDDIFNTKLSKIKHDEFILNINDEILKLKNQMW